MGLRFLSLSFPFFLFSLSPFLSSHASVFQISYFVIKAHGYWSVLIQSLKFTLLTTKTAKMARKAERNVEMLMVQEFRRARLSSSHAARCGIPVSIPTTKYSIHTGS